MNPLHLLARVYTLLAECSAADLYRAASLLGEKSPLGAALRLLADYRVDAGEDRSRVVPARKPMPSRPPVPGRAQVRAANASGSGHSAKPLTDQEAAGLEDIIVSKSFFLKQPQLLAHLQASNIAVKVAPKESRKRILIKVKRQLEMMSPGERAKSMSLLFSVLSPSETARWFSAIRKG